MRQGYVTVHVTWDDLKNEILENAKGFCSWAGLALLRASAKRKSANERWTGLGAKPSEAKVWLLGLDSNQQPSG